MTNGIVTSKSFLYEGGMSVVWRGLNGKIQFGGMLLVSVFLCGLYEYFDFMN